MTPRRTPARLLAVLTTLLAGITTAAITGPAAHADGPASGSPWVVTVGDSYISGEAGRWAGSSNTSPSYADALGPTAYFDNAGGPRSRSTGATAARRPRRTSAHRPPLSTG